jgi:3-oxoacyl-[acyl-carrier protein] reductase
MTPRVTHLWENAAVRDTFIEQTPLRKIARPDDIAEAILFLASDRTAGQITGTHLLVDGGAASTKM